MANKKAAKEVNKGGRPIKEIDKEQLYKIAQLQATYDEIAACLMMSVNTFKARLEEQLELKETIHMARESGKCSLRRAMWHKALADRNPTIQIWLSKQHLGMSDKQTIEQTLSLDSIDLSCLTTEQLQKLRKEKSANDE